MCLCVRLRQDVTWLSEAMLRSVRHVWGRFGKAGFWIKVCFWMQRLLRGICGGIFSPLTGGRKRSREQPVNRGSRVDDRGLSFNADVHRYSAAVQTDSPLNTCTGNANAWTSLCWGKVCVLLGQNTKSSTEWTKGFKEFSSGTQWRTTRKHTSQQGYNPPTVSIMQVFCHSRTHYWKESKQMKRHQFTPQ